MAQQDDPKDAAARVRRANVRTALVLASIAAVFFVGIIVAKMHGRRRSPA